MEQVERVEGPFSELAKAYNALKKATKTLQEDPQPTRRANHAWFNSGGSLLV